MGREDSRQPFLHDAYVRMRRHFGHQRWWPGETPFEVCVGAILVQNTAWTNVERAIANLKRAGLLAPRALHAVPAAKLMELVRPAGTFRVKARRLRAFLDVLGNQFDGSLEQLFTGPTTEVRARLLAIHGIGPETADSLLLYAGGHASFVVDAYTRRIFSRHGWCDGRISYDELQRRCAGMLNHVEGSARLDLWQDCHAQLVAVGKEFCRAGKPRCEECPLRELLPKEGSQ
jgi:endonuclease-3 related protein